MDTKLIEQLDNLARLQAGATAGPWMTTTININPRGLAMYQQAVRATDTGQLGGFPAPKITMQLQFVGGGYKTRYASDGDILSQDPDTQTAANAAFIALAGSLDFAALLAALTAAATPAPADAAGAGQWLPVTENGGLQDAMLEEEYLYVELPDGTVTQAMYTECNYQPEHTEIGESHAWGHHTEVDHMDPLPVQPVRYFTPPAPTPTPTPADAAGDAAEADMPAKYELSIRVMKALFKDWGLADCNATLEYLLGRAARAFLQAAPPAPALTPAPATVAPGAAGEAGAAAILTKLAEKFNPKSAENQEDLRKMSIAGRLGRQQGFARKHALEQFHAALCAALTASAAAPAAPEAGPVGGLFLQGDPATNPFGPR